MQAQIKHAFNQLHHYQAHDQHVRTIGDSFGRSISGSEHNVARRFALRGRLRYNERISHPDVLKFEGHLWVSQDSYITIGIGIVRCKVVGTGTGGFSSCSIGGGACLPWLIIEGSHAVVLNNLHAHAGEREAQWPHDQTTSLSHTSTRGVVCLRCSNKSTMLWIYTTFYWLLT
jgi:hypothetical protein